MCTRVHGAAGLLQLLMANQVRQRDFRGEQGMDRAIAEQLMQCYVALDGPLHTAGKISEKIETKEERDPVRRAIGDLVLNIYSNLMRPIIRQYPDLDPDKE
jgi:hypothetical protein